MVRPSRNLDKVLIRTGIQMMRAGGASSISVRGLCERAKVSLGMFNYLFKSRDEFLEKIHENLYHDFCAQLQTAVDREATPIQRLRVALLTLGEASVKQRKLFMSLMRDGMNKEAVIAKMQKRFVPQDLLLILRLISECKADGSINSPLDDMQILTILISVVLAPALFGESVTKCLKRHAAVKPALVTDIDYFAARIDFILRGLARCDE